jgi:hypothetical protein
MTKRVRVIPPLPASIKEQLEERGVKFEKNGTAEYELVDNEVRIRFISKKEENI